MSALRFGAVFCSSISLLCLLIALGSDYWLADSSSHMGLWKVCNHEVCHSLDVEWVSGLCVMIAMSIFTGRAGSTSQYGWSFGLGWASFPLYLLNATFHAIRTFMFLGMIAGAVTLIGLCIMNRQPRLAYMASFTAGLCIMIAMSIFTGRAGSTSKYRWSFSLGWASFPLYLL
ncbi:Claudin domain-containing protein 2, partial [Ophiophagus hannah]